MEYLELILNIVAGLVGFPALLAALINTAKYFGWLADGNAAVANMVGHLIAYIGVGVLVLTGRVEILAGLDVQLGAAATALLAVLAFLSSLATAGKANEVMSDAHLPVVGYRHPFDAENFDLRGSEG